LNKKNKKIAGSSCSEPPPLLAPVHAPPPCAAAPRRVPLHRGKGWEVAPKQGRGDDGAAVKGGRAEEVACGRGRDGGED